MGRAGLGRLGDRALPGGPLVARRWAPAGAAPGAAGRLAGSRPAAARARPAAAGDAPAGISAIAAHPERIPAGGGRELVLGWIDANGYDGANRAMRTHVFDPAGYPEDVPVTIAWGELDRLVGPPKPERRPAGARFLVLPGVGHTPTWDDPELVARTLLEGSARRSSPCVIVERTENPQWLSNAYLVADPAAGTGVLIDGNDELGPLLERAERDGIEITHVLVTHPHGDHVAGLAEARERLGNPPLVAHEATAAELDEEVEVTLGDGEKLQAGGLEIEALYTPGHAAGHLAFLIDGTDVFTADVLFKGTVGGTMAPGRQRLRRPQGLGDAADGAAAGDPRPPRPPRADDDRRGVGAATPSCGSGAASTRPARRASPSGAGRRR